MRASAPPAGDDGGERRAELDDVACLKEGVLASLNAVLSPARARGCVPRPRSLPARKKRVRRLQDASVKAWPISSIPPERIDSKRCADSFAAGEARR